VLLPCVAALGCGGAQIAQCDTTRAITLHVHPANHLNPDRAGLPRSVVVRLYQLADARAFQSSSFDRLWSGAADGLPKPEQVIALPGRSQARALPRDSAAQYLGVAANFREREDDGHWRGLVRLPAPQHACARWPSEDAAPIELTLADYSLQLR
jgi:type VI secretion system VasD/TssJ family lipoprotein